MSNRDKAKTVACPKCGVGPRVLCLKKNGTKRRSVHMERVSAAARGDSGAQEQQKSGFYHSDEWRRLRYKVLLSAGGACQCCGSRPKPGKALHVDHIKPASKYPELALDFSNLQVLCEDCNLGKSAWDQTDWRQL